MVKFLVENGADINQKDKFGKTALEMARSWGSVEIVKFLTEFLTYS